MRHPREEALRTDDLLGLPKATTGLLLLFLVAIDGLATVKVLREDVAREINPVVAWLVSHGEAPFLAGKLLVSAFCVLWMIRWAPPHLARIAALAGFAIYMPIVGLHVYMALIFLPAVT